MKDPINPYIHPSCHPLRTRRELWEWLACTRVIEAILEQQGTFTHYDDGDGKERFADPKDVATIVDACTGVDEVKLYFTLSGRKYGIHFVFGNSPEEIICDGVLPEPLDSQPWKVSTRSTHPHSGSFNKGSLK